MPATTPVTISWPRSLILAVNRSSYDDDGNLVTHAVDRDGDGTWDSIESWQYYDHGELRLEESQRDQDDDGDIDRIEQWMYDEDGKQTRYTRDDDRSNAELEWIETWQYDQRGNETRHEKDTDADGAPDYLATKTYQAVGWGYILYIWD
jgi:hypothetical protein